MHNSTHDDDQCDIKSIENCNHLKNLLVIMDNYTDLKSMDNIGYIDDINILQVLNNYIHLLNNHDNDKQFEEIVNKFNDCNIKKCKAFRRNNRNRNVSSNEIKKYDHNEIIQILDKIHCYFCHCYDIGNRLLTTEPIPLNEDEKEYLINQQMVKINEILFKKREIYNEIYYDLDISTRINKKFNQLFETNINVKYPIDEEKNQQHDEKQCSAKTYSFGYKFEYDENEPSDWVESIGAMYVTEKYSNLKEEITTNDICVLDINQYNNEYNKAQIHFNSEYNKKKCKYFDGNCLSLQYILSLMIYCNYDQLQFYFSKTFREDKGIN
eukprot:101403_1